MTREQIRNGALAWEIILAMAVIVFGYREFIDGPRKNYVSSADCALRYSNALMKRDFETAVGMIDFPFMLLSGSMAQDRQYFIKVLKEADGPLIKGDNPQLKHVMFPNQYNAFAKENGLRQQDFDTLIAVQNHIGDDGRVVVIATSLTIDGQNMTNWNKFLVKEVDGVMKVCGTMK